MNRFVKNTFLLLVISISLAGQESNTNRPDVLIDRQVSFLESSFDSVFDPQTSLINGRVYYPVGDTVNHPYFTENIWKQGELLYSGKAYKAIRLKYDIYSDALINLFRTDSSSFPVYLNRENIREFILDGHHFKFMEDTVYFRRKVLPAGYNEIIYEGKTCVYLRWIKYEESDRSTLRTVYPQDILFLLKQDGKLKLIKSKKELLKALHDRENEVRAFLKTKRLQFRSSDYSSFAEVLKYFDSLN